MGEQANQMFRIYYHLYLGPSWREIWALHLPILKDALATDLVDKLIICVCGELPGDLGITDSSKTTIREVSASIERVNEFHTLNQLRADACSPAIGFDYCVYLHSKGSSSRHLQDSDAAWSRFLALSLLRSLPIFVRVLGQGFNCGGSNLALGIFEDFGPPRLHFSGNFWCATRSLIASTPHVELGSRYASIRHNAEWWLDCSKSLVPYNVFSTGVNHYGPPSNSINWDDLERCLKASSPGGASVYHYMNTIAFLREMMRLTIGEQAIMRFISECAMRTIPYRRWPRLLTLKYMIMKVLGSRKSIFYYCAETRK